MSNIIDSTNVGRLVSDIKAKADVTYGPIDQTTEIDLATVATTGSYNDLLDKPTAATGAIVYVGTCPTAAATVTKVVTTETFPTQNGEPIVGIVIGVKFAITNTATEPKLNVNGLGAQSIYYNAAVATSTSAVYGGTKNRYTYYMWDGTNGCWLSQGLDSNDNTLAYQIRTSAQRLPVATACYRYRLLFTSADGTKWVPANASSSTNATASRTPATAKIDPFGQIAYYSYTTALSSGGQPSASYQYQQYAGVTIGYSFNNTGAAATMTSQKPIYVKCAPQTDGSAIIDSTTPYVQALPSTADGKIYIFLGIATSATAFELMPYHPVYEFKNGAIRIWTNANIPDVSGKADKVNNAVAGNLAKLDSNGNLSDAGVSVPSISGNNGKVLAINSSGTGLEWVDSGGAVEPVDLGLSVKWSSVNIGAKKPSDYGYYYAWGEVNTKSTYTSATYTYSDNPTILPASHDVATQTLGNDWRMPTDAEWTELRTNCTWTWTTQNGVNGRLVTASNGNSIFLPAAGAASGGAGSYGYYWSSSLSTDPECAWSTDFDSSQIYHNWDDDRYSGQSIRPVFSPVSVPDKLSDLSNVSSATPTDGQALIGDNANSTGKPGAAGNPNAESTNNKVTSLSSSSTDTQYPSAKAVFDFITDDEYVIASAFNDINDRMSLLGAQEIQHTQPTNGFLPNVLYNLGTLTGTVTFTLATPTNTAIENEYKIRFVTYTPAPTITGPSTITKGAGNCLDSSTFLPIIDAYSTYEISIVNGLAIIVKYS